VIGSELTIQLVVMRLLAGLLIASVQGAALAAIAVLLGDRGPRHDGRLTLLPFRHVDLVGLGAIIVSGFGWGRPVAIEAGQLRFGRWGLVIAVFGSSLVLVALGALLLLLVVPALTLLPYTAGLTIAAFLRVAARLCVFAALLALLPIPPLAGAHLLAAVGLRVPASVGPVLAWVLLILSALGVTGMLLDPLYRIVAPLVLGPEFVI